MEKVLNELATLLKANDKAFEIVSQPEWKTEMLVIRTNARWTCICHPGSYGYPKAIEIWDHKRNHEPDGYLSPAEAYEIIFGTEPEKQA